MAAPHAGFLRHERYRYLKLALLLCGLALAAYAIDAPVDGANGGTWLGYTLGTIGALLVVWLTALGIRKRRYRSTLGTVKGWTSAHVYLGLALLLIASLHAGFQFGANIHTLAYALMLAVIVSGLYGIVVYARLPTLITQNLGDSDRDALLGDILDLNQQALKLTDALDPEAHHIVQRSAEQMRIGGSLRVQLFGPRSIRRSSSAALTIAAQLAQGQRTGASAETARQLLELLNRRDTLLARLNRDIQLSAQLRIWLYLHVPLTVALLAALLAHIVTVFLYW